jgi:uncharacterized protein YqgV (UPF0045/DUF77 family)
VNDLTAQVSLYPLGQDDLAPAVDEVIEVFRAHGLRVDPGPMSTLLAGDDASLFAALHEATRVVTRGGRAVLVITVSNACTVPGA